MLSVLLEGTEETAFPPLLTGRVYGDFRQAAAYFLTAYNLIISLYNIPSNDLAVADLIESLDPAGPGSNGWEGSRDEG